MLLPISATKVSCKRKNKYETPGFGWVGDLSSYFDFPHEIGISFLAPRPHKILQFPFERLIEAS